MNGANHNAPLKAVRSDFAANNRFRLGYYTLRKRRLMNIRYRKIPDETRPEGYSFYPLLQVLVRHDLNMRPLLALVDSGAQDCIFPASTGKVLGVDVPSGKQHKFLSFNLQETSGFVHRVHLQVPGFPHWIDVDAVFVESEVMPILGESDFFESYQIVFERFRRQFEINTKADAIIRSRRGRRRGR
jgi:hypothetical protein